MRNTSHESISCHVCLPWNPPFHSEQTLLPRLSCFMFIPGTKLSLITFPTAFFHEAQTFCYSSWYETIFDKLSKPIELYSLFNLDSWLTTSVFLIKSPRHPDPDFSVSPLLSVFLYFRLIESCSAISFYANPVGAFFLFSHGSHSNNFIFLIHVLFISVFEDNFHLKLDLLYLLFI